MSERLHYTYVFHLDSGSEHRFDVVLDENLQIVNFPDDHKVPAWAELDFHKCPGCPLEASRDRYCPAAKGIAELLERFNGLNSIERTRVEVRTPARTYVKDTDLQDGVFSIMGVIMPTSGCPALKFLRPMARFHLPFSTIEETVVRSVSMFLMRHYFDDKPIPDFDRILNELNGKYEIIQSVNRSLIERIKMMERAGDVTKNAVMILMVLSQTLTFELKSHLRSFERLFAN